MDRFIVTEAAQRPARKDRTCFYCKQPVGATHKEDCVLVSKKVKVRVIIEYDVEVPASWDKEQIEFHRNEGSWCADNAIQELVGGAEAAEAADGCFLCGRSTFEYLKDTSEPYLSE